MSTPPTPDWTLEWLGHPSGAKRYVRVFFMAGSTPADAPEAGRDLAHRIEQAATEGQFKGAVLAFAQAHNLRVIDVITGPDHTYPAGDVISVAFDKAPG
jgi:hypothetical protein